MRGNSLVMRITESIIKDMSVTGGMGINIAVERGTIILRLSNKEYAHKALPEKHSPNKNTIIACLDKYFYKQ